MPITRSHHMTPRVCHNDESRNKRVVVTQRAHLDGFVRGRTIGRLECGRTKLEVSELGITHIGIFRLCQRFQDDGRVDVTAQITRELQHQMRIGIWQLLPKETDEAHHPTSLHLLVRPFQGRPCGLNARRPVRCVPTHCGLQLTWSKEPAFRTPQCYQGGAPHSLRSAGLQCDSCCIFIWRAPGTVTTKKTSVSDTFSVVQDCSFGEGDYFGFQNRPAFSNRNHDRPNYRDVIPEQYVHLFRGALRTKFVFMDDNARVRRANIVSECLQSEDITHMDWPAFSQDWNLIEHVWDMVGRQVADR
ncbi:transposable element Tcb1 transposase [Trichonephila clavipes]|nr:transposable element Tcb1 transposase [Trichonephila clavipes]